MNEDAKKKMLDAIAKESDAVIALAYMYAKNFEEVGFDVTRRMITAEKNVQYLESVYKKGVDDTLERIRKGEVKV